MSHRDQYLKEVEALYIESKAPLDQRDNRFFDSTLKLFLQAGKSNFDHKVWRESEMLTEMITLHQTRYIKLNHHESIEIERRRDDLTFEDWIALEQEVDDSGMTALEYLERATTIAITYDREKLEIWAAENHLSSQVAHKKEEEGENMPPPANNYLTFQQLKEDIKEHDKFAKKGTVQQYSYRAVKKAYQESQALPVQLEGYLKNYQLVKLGEIMPNERQPDVRNCLYQKINPTQQQKGRSSRSN